jgi:iron-sulfur cluster assembly protein
MIEVTEKAARKIRQTVERPGEEWIGLRLGVQGGGCSGYSYVCRFEKQQRATDQVFDYSGAKVFVDPKSLRLLEGMVLDYTETLMESRFVFENPNAGKTCGCGVSFSLAR